MADSSHPFGDPEVSLLRGKSRCPLGTRGLAEGGNSLLQPPVLWAESWPLLLPCKRLCLSRRGILLVSVSVNQQADCKLTRALLSFLSMTFFFFLLQNEQNNLIFLFYIC